MGESFLCYNNQREKKMQQKSNERQGEDKLVLFVQTLVQKSNADQNTANHVVDWFPSQSETR